MKQKTGADKIPFYKNYTLIFLLCFIFLMLGVVLCRAVNFSNLSPKPHHFSKVERQYDKLHKADNNPNPVIDYTSIPKNIRQKHFHIDSYVIRNKKDIYFDSLLERYSYYNQGNRNFVLSYSGSHGIISPTDELISTTSALQRPNLPCVALNRGAGYSDLNLRLSDIIDYANQFRILSIYRNSGKAHNTYSTSSRTFPIYSGYSGDYNFYYITDCAPSESYMLEAYLLDAKGGEQTKYKIDSFWADKFKVKWFVPIFQYMLNRVDNDGVEHWSYGFLDDGDFSDSIKTPEDKTKKFLYKPVDSRQLYYAFKNHTLYSNGNAYFLSKMYQNYDNITHYRFIDAYQHDNHLSPLVFNNFVRPANKYNSPYLFSYKAHSLHDKQDMLNYVEGKDNNLPSMYDKHHYYYRTIEGTVVRDDNIMYVNNYIRPMIMGKPNAKRNMPTSKADEAYYNTNLEFEEAFKNRKDPIFASQMLNYKRTDGGFEPLWKIGLTNNKRIGTYHPGEMVRYDDKLSTKKISHYYIVDNGVKKYLPVYNINDTPCFKATVTFKGQTRHYVRAQDAYMLMGCEIQHD